VNTIAALAVRAGVPHSLHARRIRAPRLDEVTDGLGVLVRVLQVGVDGTDREIIEAQFGTPPPGDDHLIIGHENLGRVEAVGPAVRSIAPGDLVVATVRRPGSSPYDRIGRQDFTTDEVVRERGINLLHGYLAEQFVDHEQFFVRVPAALERVGVLTEPASVSQKGIAQAYAIQSRLGFWSPSRACVIGAGTIGLLAALALRLRGLEVVVYSRRPAPYRNSDLVEALGGSYVSSRDTSLDEAVRTHGPWDLVFEASGFSPFAFESLRAVGPNGVVVLSGVTGGEHRTELDTNALNQTTVLHNKVLVGTVNASPAHFASAVHDMLAAESRFPGWLERLLTTPIEGVADPAAVWHHLAEDDEAIKVYVRVSA
jgi:threonine dehydrogenase-like Zn-dependent dehydrogenase